MVVGVENSVVLYGAVFANDDVAVIGSNHCTRPDAGAFPDGHVTNDIGGFADEGRRVYAGAFSI
jgi:hypothetical protein